MKKLNTMKPMPPHPQDFPKFYKNGSRFTRIDSKSQFTEVTMMKTQTLVRTVSNLHMVEGALEHDTVTDKETFDRAFKNAMNKISLTNQ